MPGRIEHCDRMIYVQVGSDINFVLHMCLCTYYVWSVYILFRKYYCFEIHEISGAPTQCENYRNFLTRFFDKNIVKVMFLLKSLPKRLYQRIEFSVRVNFSNFHTVAKEGKQFCKFFFSKPFCENDLSALIVPPQGLHC